MTRRFHLFAVALLAVAQMSCSDSRVTDSPAQRKVLAIEAAQLALSTGTFAAITEAAAEQAVQVFAARMQGEIGRELAKSEYDKARSAFKEAFTSTLPAKEWEVPFADLYAKYYTAPELEQLLKFYKTAAGVKLLQTQDALTREGAQIGMRLFESKKEEFDRVFQRELAKK